MPRTASPRSPVQPRAGSREDLVQACEGAFAEAQRIMLSLAGDEPPPGPLAPAPAMQWPEPQLELAPEPEPQPEPEPEPEPPLEHVRALAADPAMPAALEPAAAVPESGLPLARPTALPTDREATPPPPTTEPEALRAEQHASWQRQEAQVAHTPTAPDGPTGAAAAYEQPFEEGTPPEDAELDRRTPRQAGKKSGKKKKKPRRSQGQSTQHVQLQRPLPSHAIERVDRRQWRAEVAHLMREMEKEDAQQTSKQPWSAIDEVDPWYSDSEVEADSVPLAERVKRHEFRPPAQPTRWVGEQNWTHGRATRPPVGSLPSLLHESGMIETASLDEVSPFEDNLNGSRSPSAQPAGSGRRKAKKGGGGSKRRAASAAAARRRTREEEEEQARNRAAEMHALMSHAAKWVAVHGDEFEELLRHRHSGTPGWSFLAAGEEHHDEYKLLLAREREMAEVAKVGALEAVQAAVMRRQGNASLAVAAAQLVGEKTGAELRPEAAADLVALGASQPQEQEQEQEQDEEEEEERVEAPSAVDAAGSSWLVEGSGMDRVATAPAGML
jgi:hypothetical protein